MSIFKSCDIRGVYGVDLNERLAFDLGRAIARRHAGRAVVGGDLRASTPVLKSALIDGLCAAGAEVVDLGLLPTPAFYHAKHLLQAPVGAMVTASHNPARYNGFKLMFGDLPVEPEDVAQLAQDVSALPSACGALPPASADEERENCAQRVDTLADYEATLTAAFPGLSARRVLVDAGNGSMWQVAPAVLRACGQKVVELYCTPDGRYPNRDPNPSVPAHLQAIAQCESGGDLTAIGGGGLYRGKYQFSVATWQAVGGKGDPAAAPEAEQDRRAIILYNTSGPGQWPVCSQ